MAGHIIAILLFAASSLAAQPLVFGVTERLPANALHVEGTGPLPLMTTNGDGFLALDGHTLVKLDDAGNTLRRSSFAPALNISAESLWPLGRDYLLGTVIEPAWIVDGETLAIRQLPATFTYPAALATNGSTILVLEPSARATLLDRNGTVLSPPKPLLAPSPPQGLGGVATDGVGYLVVWKDEFLLRSVRVDAAGSVSSKETLRALEVQQYPLFPPRVAFGGGKFLVIWQDSNKLYAQLRNADGSEAAGVVVLDTNLPKADSAVWDGAEFLVTFGSRFARIGGDGKLLDVPRPLDAAPGRTIRGAVAAANGHATIVARHEACSCGECVEAWRRASVLFMGRPSCSAARMWRGRPRRPSPR